MRFHLLYDEEDRESEVEEMLRKKFSIEKLNLYQLEQAER